MTLGPAPVDRVKTESKKQQPTEGDVNGKARQESMASVAVADVGRPTPASTRRFSQPLPEPLAAPQISMDLGLPTLTLEKPANNLPKWIMIGVGVAVLGAVAVISMSGRKTSGDANPNVVEAGPALAAVQSAWIPDWFNDTVTTRQRQISILSSSLNLTDYRAEFEAQIQTKAVGWVFRAQDRRNFYVMKLEVVNPGPHATLALERFAVIDGDEQPHSEVALTVPETPGDRYKIRFEAVGSRFITWVQDRKVDEMTDGRIKSGGVGLYRERGELASLVGSMRVVPLAFKK